MTDDEADLFFWTLVRHGLRLLCDPDAVDPQMWRDVRRGLLSAVKAIELRYGTESTKERAA